MSRYLHQWTGLIATLLLLRAVVPVGYMLQLPGPHAPSLPALVLCPLQNPGLDLTRLDTGAAGHTHHHHSAESTDVPAATVEVRGDCPVWQSGSVATLDYRQAGAVPVLRPVVIATSSSWQPGFRHPRPSHRTRAPPPPVS